MTNPSGSSYGELCDVIEATYQALSSDDPQAVAKIHAGSETMARAGREVLRQRGRVSSEVTDEPCIPLQSQSTSDEFCLALPSQI